MGNCKNCTGFKRREGCGYGDCKKIQDADLMQIDYADDWCVSMEFGCILFEEIPYSKCEYDGKLVSAMTVQELQEAVVLLGNKEIKRMSDLALGGEQ